MFLETSSILSIRKLLPKMIYILIFQGFLQNVNVNCFQGYLQLESARRFLVKHLSGRPVSQNYRFNICDFTKYAIHWRWFTVSF